MPWTKDLPSDADWQHSLEQASSSLSELYQTTYFWKSKASDTQNYASTNGASSLGRITQRLVAYHRITKTDISSRIQGIALVLKEIQDFKKKYEHFLGLTPPAYLCNTATLQEVNALAQTAEEKRDYLVQLKEHLNRKFGLKDLLELRFTPSTAKTPRLIGLDPGYWIELTHPRHATSQVNRSLGSLFQEWQKGVREGTVRDPFYLWLECDNRLAQVRDPSMQVEYLKEGERAAFELSVTDGLIYRAKSRTDLTLVLYDTTGFDDDNLATFVIAPDKKVYSAQHERGKFHHSSFLAGGKVICAGMIGVKNGHAEVVTPKSGHYKAGYKEFMNGLDVLQELGIIGDDVMVNLAFWKDQYIKDTVKDFSSLNSILNSRGHIVLPLKIFRQWCGLQCEKKKGAAIAWVREQEKKNKERLAKEMVYIWMVKKRFPSLLQTILKYSKQYGKLKLPLSKIEEEVMNSESWKKAINHPTHPLESAVGKSVLRAMLSRA